MGFRDPADPVAVESPSEVKPREDREATERMQTPDDHAGPTANGWWDERYESAQPVDDTVATESVQALLSPRGRKRKLPDQGDEEEDEFVVARPENSGVRDGDGSDDFLSRKGRPPDVACPLPTK